MTQKVLFPVVTKIDELDLDTGGRNITHVGIHHSASSWGDAETFNDWHRQRGFISKSGDGIYCGYHFIINNGTRFPEGFIQLGRPLDRTPAAHRPKNTGSIAICLVGNYSDREPESQRTFTSLILLCNRIRRDHQLNGCDFYGHRELNDGKTECPGTLFDMDSIRDDIIFLNHAAWQYNDHVLDWIPTKDRVACLQRLLNRYFKKNLADDGILGPLTKAAWISILPHDTMKSYDAAWKALMCAIGIRGPIKL